jgi:hypothetical protein
MGERIAKHAPDPRRLLEELRERGVIEELVGPDVFDGTR